MHVVVPEPAEAIRTACNEYQASSKTTQERYDLLEATLDAMYEHVGISFELVAEPPEAPVLESSSCAFEKGESFLLDGQFTFSKVRIFEPATRDE